MNEFDQWVKHTLKAKYYIRYADDFVFFHIDKFVLKNYLKYIEVFLEIKLKLKLHPKKVSITTLSSGIDFLGWVNFLNHRVLRTSTKRRMFKNINKNFKKESINSYLGMLSHGNGYKLEMSVKSSKNMIIRQ